MNQTRWHLDRANTAHLEAVFAGLGVACLLSCEWSPEKEVLVAAASQEVRFLQGAAQRLAGDLDQHLAGC